MIYGIVKTLIDFAASGSRMFLPNPPPLLLASLPDSILPTFDHPHHHNLTSIGTTITSEIASSASISLLPISPPLQLFKGTEEGIETPLVSVDIF